MVSDCALLVEFGQNESDPRPLDGAQQFNVFHTFEQLSFTLRHRFAWLQKPKQLLTIFIEIQHLKICKNCMIDSTFIQ